MQAFYFLLTFSCEKTNEQFFVSSERMGNLVRSRGNDYTGIGFDLCIGDSFLPLQYKGMSLARLHATMPNMPATVYESLVRIFENPYLKVTCEIVNIKNTDEVVYSTHFTVFDGEMNFELRGNTEIELYLKVKDEETPTG